MIAILDYGVGNLGSIANMLKKLGINHVIINSAEQVVNAEKLIIPGVGAFDHGMSALNVRNLSEPIKEAVLVKRVPTLGICLGMQILLDSSEEGSLPGLGLISGSVRKFRFSEPKYKIPHMGWNTLKIEKPNPLLKGNEEQRFYFVHSYFVDCLAQNEVIATTEYGKTFAAAMQKDNLFAVQFHPEKSHHFGLNLLSNFSKV